MKSNVNRAPQCDWVFSTPEWWIDQIHQCVKCQEFGEALPPFGSPIEYFANIGDRVDATMSHLRGTRGLKSYQVRRSLFYAKAMKKWRLDVPGIDTRERKTKAMAGFQSRNIVASLQDDVIPTIQVEMRRLLERWLPDTRGFNGTVTPVCEDWLQGKFGPGAVAERATHPMRFEMMRRWCEHEEVVGHRSALLGLGSAESEKLSCRLCAVPKDYNKDRLITVEPAWASFTQQHVRSLMLESIHRGPLKGTCMDLGYVDGQAMQRRLALQASLDKSLATLDLSNASDGITWTAVQAVFPEWLVELLWNSRSSRFYLPGQECDATPLHIFAGMGNATTFPVETLFFSAYVEAFRRVHGIASKSEDLMRVQVSVFGDDIICHDDVARALIEDGDHPYFQVNVAKSFLGNDTIRESCGIFAYEGEDVTVPKISGYTPTWEGREGICQLHACLSASPDAWARKLASAIAHVGVLDNWPFLVDGYPSIEDWSADWSALPTVRTNHDYQTKEVRVIVREPRTVSYPKMDSDLSVLDCCGLARLTDRQWTRERFSYLSRFSRPPALTWYLATLAGLLGPGRTTLNCKEGPSTNSASFPTGKFKEKARWRTIRPDGVVSPLDYESSTL